VIGKLIQPYMCTAHTEFTGR